MKTHLSLLFKRIWQAYGWKVLVLVSLIAFTGFLEGSAIAALLPLLQLLGIGDASQGSMITNVFSSILSTLNLPLSPFVIGAFAIFLFISQYIIFLIHSWFTARVNNAFTARLRYQLFKKTIHANWTFLLKRKQSDIINAIISETARNGQAFEQCISLFSTSLIVLIYITMALFISWKITASLILAGAIISVLLFTMIKRGHEIGKGISEKNEALMQCTTETLGGAKLIKATSAEQYVSNIFYHANNSLKSLLTWTSFYPCLMRALVEVLAIVSILATLIISRNFYQIDIAVTLMVLAIFVRIYPRLTLLQQSFQILSLHLPSVGYTNALETQAADHKEADISLSKTSLNILDQEDIQLSIQVKDLSFQYPTGPTALKNINCSIPAGKFIAIVGSSGSGKTTFLDCLLGLLTPGRGDILVNGNPLSTLDLSAWRNTIGYIAQDTILFNTTIADNIAWTHSNAPMGEIIHAATLANAHDFILQKPDGYQKIVGDKGCHLSGGQRQRIGIARALLNQPKILLLDEATNALDSKTEADIMKTIESLRGKMTIICVTHRLSTIKNADIIYQINKGEMSEVSLNDINPFDSQTAIDA